MKRTCVAVASLILLSGCGTKLSAGGRDVRVAKSAHSNCEELDVVYGSGGGGGYTSSEQKMESAQNELRNKTAKLGGNLVVMDAAGGDAAGFTLSGRAFKCGDEEPTPVRVVDASSEPDAPREEGPSHEERLTKLKKLLDDGHITQEEYDSKRQAILDSI